MEALCSLSLIDRELNDQVRRAAAACAIASKYKDISPRMPFSSSTVSGTATSYEVLTPDPLEDPKGIYVDVRVTVVEAIQHAKDTDEDIELVARALRSVNPWRDDDEEGDEGPCESLKRGPRRRFIDKGCEFARVDLDPCYERCEEFYRRLTLYELARLISHTYNNNRQEIVDWLFEQAVELTVENSLQSLWNRSKFTKEALADWFFDLDTYSKCITLIEAFSQSLHLSCAPVRVDLYDVYCKLFTRIKRKVYVNMLNKSELKTQLKELSVLEDVKMTPVATVIENFLSFSLEKDESSRGYTNLMHRQAATSTSYDEFESLFKTLTKMIPGGASGEDHQQLQRVANSNTSAPPNNKRLRLTAGKGGEYGKEEEGSDRYSVLNGHRPFTVSLREVPIIFKSSSMAPVSLFNQLLFPVYSSETPEDILFFAKPKKSTIATLFLPGLFRFKGQYLSGDCKELSSSFGNDDSVGWRYTLSDYSPLRNMVHPSTKNRNTFFSFLQNGPSKGSVLLPLFC